MFRVVLGGLSSREKRAAHLVVEVDAADGDSAWAAHRRGYRTLSYVPSPTTFSIIQRRVQPNSPDTPNFRNALVGAANGTVVYCQYSRLTRQLPPGTEQASCKGTRTEVPVVTLDGTLAEPVFCLKVGEGHQHQALRGAAHLLGQRAIRSLLLELNPALMSRTASDPLDLLLWLGCHRYTLYPLALRTTKKDPRITVLRRQQPSMVRAGAQVYLDWVAKKGSNIWADMFAVRPH
eukprot:EG_transcript_18027